MGYAEEAMKTLHEGPGSSATYSRLNPVLDEVGQELAKARQTHAPMNSHHEGYAVILEELDELWDVCKRNTHANHMFGHEPQNVERQRAIKRGDMRKEALQVAAMAVRFIEDVCDKN